MFLQLYLSGNLAQIMQRALWLRENSTELGKAFNISVLDALKPHFDPEKAAIYTSNLMANCTVIRRSDHAFGVVIVRFRAFWSFLRGES